MDGLTKADLQRVREAYRLADDLEKQIERAKHCNIECEEIDQRCQLAKKQCAALIEMYGPHFPPGK